MCSSVADEETYRSPNHHRKPDRRRRRRNLRLSGRRDSAHLRRPARFQNQARPGPPRAGCCAHGRRLRARKRTARRGNGYLGPGATNAVTGIADANMDSTPMVVISGQVPTTMIGNDAFQEADFVGITRPCTKHNYLIKDVRTWRASSRRHSTSRAPAVPVRWWSTSRRTCSRPSTFSNIPSGRIARLQAEHQGQSAPDRTRYRGDRKERQAAFLRRRRGAMVGRCARTYPACARDGHPDDRNPDGPRLVPASDPLCLGMLGMHGSYGTNTAVCNTDCLVSIGARFDDRVTGRIADFAPHAKTIIHIDIDPSSISKNVKVDIRSSAISSRCWPTC